MSDSVSINNGVAVGKDVKAPEVGLPSWRRWWALDLTKNDGAEVANAIGTTLKQMRGDQRGRIDQATVAARLYGKASVGALVGGTRAPAAWPAPDVASTQNVVQSIIDTSTATIGENKPRPYYLTDGGDFKLQRQAKKLNRFSDGLFYELQAYNHGSDAQRDGEIFGDGWLYVGVEFGRIVFQRVLSVEMWCDELEASMGLPRQLLWERPVDRERLVALHPKKKTLIVNADRVDPRKYGMAPTSTSDMVLLRRAWHLRSGDGAPDGLFVTSIEGAVLDHSEWTEDWYPFARFAWTPMPAEFWSQGLAEQLRRSQIRYNKLSHTLDASMHRAGTFKVFLEKGSKVVKEHVNNEIGAIVEYVGTPPNYAAPPAVHPDHFQRMDMLEEGMWNQAGLSKMIGQAEKPAGLDSGTALRTYRDSTSLRMKTQERLNEQGYLDLARISVAMARQIALASGKPYEVRTSNQRSLAKISMSADELNPKDWRLQCFPTSSLPKDPAGKFAAVQERIQAGFLTFREGKKLLDFPDLAAADALTSAAEEVLEKTITDIMDEGLYAPPEPTDNLQLAKQMVVEYINFGRLHGLEEDRLALLHNWSAQVDALMLAAMPPPMPGAMPGGEGAPLVPQGQPAAPPTSNLMPFAA